MNYASGFERLFDIRPVWDEKRTLSAKVGGRQNKFLGLIPFDQYAALFYVNSFQLPTTFLKWFFVNSTGFIRL